MRYVGLDYGEKRIGVAVSDSDGRLAVPVASFVRSKDVLGDIRKLAQLIGDYEPGTLVVGKPVKLTGKSGASVESATDFVEKLTRYLDIEVVFHDERFTTQEASRLLRQANMSSKAQRSVIDASAAAVILQSYLDLRAGA